MLAGTDTDTTSLDVLRGVQESIVLFGEERYEPIRARVLDYPHELRLAMVRNHLKLTPSWVYDGMGRDRGDLVVFYEYVLATMRSLVGVLAGLNSVYVAPDKLKRVGAVVGRMELTPPDAAARLDALLDLPREQVKPELDDLVERTLELVEQHLPEVDTRSRPQDLVAARRALRGAALVTGVVTESWRIALISMVQPVVERLVPVLRELGHEPVGVVSARLERDRPPDLTLTNETVPHGHRPALRE